MHPLFDIFQGVGVAAAVGIRPFLPALVVGALAAGDVEIHFKGTGYAFLQHPPFLIAMALAAIVLALAEWRLEPPGERLRAQGDPTRVGPGGWTRAPLELSLGAIASVAGGVLFAGSLARGHYAVWPGWIGGVVCAAVGAAATWPLLARVRTRLDPDVARSLPLYAEGVALALAALAVVAPPVGPIALALLLWLLLAGRGRKGQKYAGLRVLR